MMSPIILFSQGEKSAVVDQGLSIGAKYSFNNKSSWFGIDFGMTTINVGETEYTDLEGNQKIENIIIPQHVEVLVFGYSRTIDHSSIINNPINDFSFDLLRMPAETDVPFVGKHFPSGQINILKFGFMNTKSSTNNVWYYRPEIGFSYRGLSLLYSYSINFKKDIEWVKNNKHLITVRFSKIIFKY